MNRNTLLCSSNPAQAVLLPVETRTPCGRQDFWEWQKLGPHITLYSALASHLVVFNALFRSEALGFDNAKTFLKLSVAMLFPMEKRVFNMLGIKLNACVLATLLLSHCLLLSHYCLLFLRTWPSPPQWIGRNLSNPPSSLAVQFAVLLQFTRQQLFPPKAQKKSVSHKWQLKSEALSQAVCDSVEKTLSVVILFLSPGSCVPQQFQRTERRYVQVTNTRSCTNQYYILEYLHTVFYSI